MDMFSIIAALLTCSFVQANFDIRSLTSEGYKLTEVHVTYADAYRQLEKKYSNERTNIKDGVMEDVREILLDYCEGKYLCESDANDAIEAATKSAMDGKFEIKLPQHIDMILKELLERAITAITPLDQDNLDDVLESLTEIKEEAQEMGDLVDYEKEVIIDIMGTAIESTKLWYNAYFDPNHSLHFMFKTEDRRWLQICEGNEFLIDPVFVIIAGILAAATLIPRFILVRFLLLIIRPFSLAITPAVTIFFVVRMAFRAISAAAAMAALSDVSAILYCAIND